MGGRTYCESSSATESVSAVTVGACPPPLDVAFSSAVPFCYCSSSSRARAFLILPCVESERGGVQCRGP